jgi:hypothetical protein
MKWKQPPIIKIYEALGVVADGRVEVSGNTARVFSSSGNKFYTVSFEPEKNAIMANDNGSYFRGYLGYPAIAFLLKTDLLEFRPELAAHLKGIAWKDLNTKFKNDFEKTLQNIEQLLSPEEKKELSGYVKKDIDKAIKDMALEVLGPKTLPPKGY